MVPNSYDPHHPLPPRPISSIQASNISYLCGCWRSWYLLIYLRIYSYLRCRIFLRLLHLFVYVKCIFGLIHMSNIFHLWENLKLPKGKDMPEVVVSAHVHQMYFRVDPYEESPHPCLTALFMSWFNRTTVVDREVVGVPKSMHYILLVSLGYRSCFLQ